MVGVLLHQEDRHPFLRQFAQDAKDLFDDQRRQPQAGFIQQQQLWPAHQRARNRQHLLLTAGHGHCPLVAPLLQAREQREHTLYVLINIMIA